MSLQLCMYMDVGWGLHIVGAVSIFWFLTPLRHSYAGFHISSNDSLISNTTSPGNKLVTHMEKNFSWFGVCDAMSNPWNQTRPCCVKQDREGNIKELCFDLSWTNSFHQHFVFAIWKTSSVKGVGCIWLHVSYFVQLSSSSQVNTDTISRR